MNLHYQTLLNCLLMGKQLALNINYNPAVTHQQSSSTSNLHAQCQTRTMPNTHRQTHSFSHKTSLVIHLSIYLSINLYYYHHCKVNALT